MGLLEDLKRKNGELRTAEEHCARLEARLEEAVSEQAARAEAVQVGEKAYREAIGAEARGVADRKAVTAARRSWDEAKQKQGDITLVVEAITEELDRVRSMRRTLEGELAEAERLFWRGKAAEAAKELEEVTPRIREVFSMLHMGGRNAHWDEYFFRELFGRGAPTPEDHRTLEAELRGKYLS